VAASTAAPGNDTTRPRRAIVRLAGRRAFCRRAARLAWMGGSGSRLMVIRCALYMSLRRLLYDATSRRANDGAVRLLRLLRRPAGHPEATVVNRGEPCQSLGVGV
jgi:hypothetical protein